MASDRIIIRGAREHNLKAIDLEIQRDQLVVITGLSGSGKSSLAFDTIYAWGRRGVYNGNGRPRFLGGIAVKIISAKVLDATHLELSQPIPAKTGDLIEISIPDDDEDDRLWKVASGQKFLSAYDPANSIYDNL